MAEWRTQGFLTKAWGYTLLAVVVMFSDVVDLSWLDGASSNRKRVFSPGFVVLCVFVAFFELVLLNHFYGV